MSNLASRINRLEKIKDTYLALNRCPFESKHGAPVIFVDGDLTMKGQKPSPCMGCGFLPTMIVETVVFERSQIRQH